MPHQPMYLERVALDHWGCHTRFEAPFVAGLNLIQGPNGVGKSTLFQAILLALTEKHNTKGIAIRNWIPFDSDGVGPSVTLHLIRGDGCHRVTKTFVHKASCRIEPPAPAERLTGRTAEGRLEAWFQGDGAAGLLMRSLWSDQHDATRLLDPALDIKKNSPASLLQPLVESDVETESQGPFAILHERLRRGFDERFTPGRHQFKSGSALSTNRDDFHAAENALQEIEQAVTTLRNSLDTLAAAEADRDTLAARVADLHSQQGALRARRESFDLQSKEFQASHEAVVTAERAYRERHEAENALSKAIEQTKIAALKCDECRAQARAAENAHEVNRTAHEAFEAKRTLIDGLIVELLPLVDRREKLETSKSEIAKLNKSLRTLETKTAQQTQTRDAAATTRETTHAELARLRHCLQAQARAESVTLETARLSRIDKQLAAMAHLDSQGANQPAPTVDEMKHIASLVRELGALDQSIDEQPVQLSILPENPIELSVLLPGQPPESCRLAASIPARFDLKEELTLIVPGLGRVELKRTGAQAEQRRHRRESLARALEETWNRWNVPDFAALEERRQLASQRHLHTAKLEADLRGETAEAVRAALTELQAAVAQDPVPESTPVTPADLTIAETAAKAADKAATQAREAAIRVEEQHSQARGQLELANQTLHDLAGGDVDAVLSELKSQIDANLQNLASTGESLESPTRNAATLCRQRLENERKRLADLLAKTTKSASEARTQLATAEVSTQFHNQHLEELRRKTPLSNDDDARKSALNDALKTFHVVQDRHKALTTPVDPSDAIKKLEAELHAAEATHAAAAKACQQLELEIARLQGHGLEGRRVRALEHLETCREKFEEVRRDAAAWALLRTIADDAQAALAQTVATRIAELAQKRVASLTEAQVSGIELKADALEPVRARIRSLNGTFNVDRCSRGTREQIALGCRVAIGELLAQNGRQMLLLDEPLAHTDATRQRAALTLLHELSQSLQILIFTCHPERYEPLASHPEVGRIAIQRQPGTP